MHCWLADGEGCVIPGITPTIILVLAHRVPLLCKAVGHAQAAPLLGCPTVPPVNAPRPCERSGQQYARFTRMRVLNNLSIYEEKVKEVGQWGTAFDLGSLPCPTLIQSSGAGQTAPKSASRDDVFADIRRAFSCLTHLFAGGIKTRLLPPESTCKK